MGVDNVAVLFVGLDERQCNIQLLPEMTDELYDQYNGDFWRYSKNHGDVLNGLILHTQDDNGYNRSIRFLGFEISRTRSYGFNEVKISDFQNKVQLAIETFFRVFGQEPKVFLIEYQC